ncbi:CPBP family intramembrane glutamic endopeptidase [Bythopirellula goksoeyrii]|uniref:CAAX amino terminal protease self-immunity n=1 Tax=Bythopirellula goksoeyrii TaxID=1400387 RepID=A0A5B9QJ42_9BACT|nr:CPBP family intramembrane glutamic endopeptidase [Bythopirellula goksoeyrii]QEG34123.1 CAAX amino terminal protease self- immunity [Bythopirellula goksoeyrii]
MPDVMPTSALLFMLAATLASIGALLVLFERHVGGTPLLAYQPRQRVPWQSGIVMLVMLLTFSGVIFTLSGAGQDPHDLTEAVIDPEYDDPQLVGEPDTESSPVPEDSVEEEVSAQDFILNSLGTTVFLILLVVVIGVWLHLSVGANSIDLGLPQSGEQVLHDIGIGSVACAAALLPIYVIQLGLTILLQPEVEHPIVEQLSESHSPGMLLAGFLLVVVAAPLGEEFVFRLLLQGWLERWEDEMVGFTGSDRRSSEESSELDGEVPAAIEESIVGVDDGQPLTFPAEHLPLPRQGVLATLPHGWVPILISGILFGLAHLGHGVSPVPLVLFGIVLGYLYQRTHRLVPSIAAHALFNAYSMIMLWLQLGD